MSKRKAAPGQGPKGKRRKMETEDGTPIDILVIKVGLNIIVRPQYQKIVSTFLEEKSIESTKICALASQYFLFVVKQKYNNADWDYFATNCENGEKVVEECFRNVLLQNKENLDPDFRDFIETLDADNRFSWPRNQCFGNQLQYIYEQYATNVKTNLVTHCEKRIAQYLKLKAWQHNVENQNVPDATILDKKDIGHATNWAAKRWDSTRHDLERRRKREILLEMLRDVGGPNDDNVIGYTKNYWFQSLPMWLYMEEEIDNYHVWVEEQRQQQQQQQQNQPVAAPQQQPEPQLSKRQRQHLRRAEQQPFQIEQNFQPSLAHLSHRRRKRQRRIIAKKQKQMAANYERQINQPQVQQQRQGQRRRRRRRQKPNDEFPKIKNLVIIPMSTFQRKAVRLDKLGLFEMMRTNRLLPKNEYGAATSRDDFFADPARFWKMIFNLEEIDRIVSLNKQFDHQIVSDGISASVQYNFLRSEMQLDLSSVRNKYCDKKIVYEIGIDPGLHTWNASVRRNIRTKKEVCILYLLNFLQFLSECSYIFLFYSSDQFQDKKSAIPLHGQTRYS